MEVLLTRRQTLQSLAAAAVFSTGAGATLFGLAGCGGGGAGGGGGGVKLQTLRIPVELPAGFSLPLNELEGGTAFGTGPLDAQGFSAKINADAPTFAYLRHKPTGKFVLAALVGAGRLGLTPLGSGVASMAISMGYVGLPSTNLTQALALLEGNADVKALGDAIASAMATDPYAITAEEGAVATAMKVAFDALKGGANPQSKPGASPRAATRGRAPAPLIQVAPSDEQGGFRVDQGDPGQIVPTNLKRRPAAAYTYRVGHTPGAGASDGSAAVRTNVQDIVATTSLLGSVLTIGASPAWAAVPGQGVDLTNEGKDTKTHYETVVLMGSSGWGSDPAFFAEPRYAGEIAEWRAKSETLNEYAFNGIVLDIFKTIGSSALGALSYAQSAAISGQLASTLQPAILVFIKKGGFYGGLRELLRLMIGGNTASRRVVLFALQQTGAITTGLESAAITASIVALAEFALAALAASGALLGLADAVGTGWDSVTSPTGVRWQETALKADIAITPETQTIVRGASATLTADVVGRPATSETVYTWKITGGSDLAVLSDGHGKTGRSFETGQASVTLATTPSTQGDVTVSVEAFVGDDVVGPATAKVILTEAQPYILQTIYGIGDGTLTVFFNDSVIYTQFANTYHNVKLPADAKAGDTCRVQLKGSTTRLAGLGGIAYLKPDGTQVFVYRGETLTAPYPDPQVDFSFTLQP